MRSFPFFSVVQLTAVVVGCAYEILTTVIYPYINHFPCVDDITLTLTYMQLNIVRR